MPDTIKTFLVDDHEMILDSLKLLLNLSDEIDIVGTESDSRNVLNRLKEEDVDVLVTDYRMPYLDGLQLTRQVKENFPEVKVLVLTVNEEPADIQDAYQSGALGYMMKKASRKELHEAIVTVAKGQKFFSHEAMEAMMSPKVRNEESNALIRKKVEALTKREIEIVKLLAEELSSAEIAKQLFITPGTVESHRHNILRKLDVKSTIGVIKFALKSGIITR